MFFPNVVAGENPLPHLSARRHNALNKLLAAKQPVQQIPQTNSFSSIKVLCKCTSNPLLGSGEDIPPYQLAVVAGYNSNYEKDNYYDYSQMSTLPILQIWSVNQIPSTEDIFLRTFVIPQEKAVLDGSAVECVIFGLSWLFVDPLQKITTDPGTALYDGIAPKNGRYTPSIIPTQQLCYGGPIRRVIPPQGYLTPGKVRPELVFLNNEQPQMRLYIADEDIDPNSYGTCVKRAVTRASGFPKQTTTIKDEVYNMGSEVILDGTELQVITISGRLVANWEDCSGSEE